MAGVIVDELRVKVRIRKMSFKIKSRLLKGAGETRTSHSLSHMDVAYV